MHEVVPMHQYSALCPVLLRRTPRRRYTDDAAHTAYTGSAKYAEAERAVVGDDYDWVRICNKYRCVQSRFNEHTQP